MDLVDAGGRGERYRGGAVVTGEHRHGDSPPPQRGDHLGSLRPQFVADRDRAEQLSVGFDQHHRRPGPHALERLIPLRFRDVHRSQVEGFSRSGTTSRQMGALGTIRGLRSDGEEFPIDKAIAT